MKHIIQIITRNETRTASVEAYRKGDELKLWTKIHSPDFTFRKEPEFLLVFKSDKVPSAMTVSKTLLSSPKWSQFFHNETEDATEETIVLEDVATAPTAPTVEVVATAPTAPTVEVVATAPTLIQAKAKELMGMTWLAMRALGASYGLQTSHVKKHDLALNIAYAMHANKDLRTSTAPTVEVVATAPTAPTVEVVATAPTAPTVALEDLMKIIDRQNAQIQALLNLNKV